MRHDGLTRSALRPTLEPLEVRWVPANVGSANLNFIDQLYRDVLHRAPDPGSAGWVSQLDTGTSRDKVVTNILNSNEGLQNQVNDLYIRFLGRPADESGLTFWTDYLRGGQHTNREMAVNLLASPEYYQMHGGTNQDFLNAVYEDVLCRPITAGEVSDRNDDFSHGIKDRADVAENILGSGEAEDMQDQHSVRSFLRADVTPNQAQDIVGSNDDHWVFARSLLSSDAYFNKSQTLQTTDFATIPSCDDLAAQPLTAAQLSAGSTTSNTSTTSPTSTTSTTTPTSTSSTLM